MKLIAPKMVGAIPQIIGDLFTALTKSAAVIMKIIPIINGNNIAQGKAKDGILVAWFEVAQSKRQLVIYRKPSQSRT